MTYVPEPSAVAGIGSASVAKHAVPVTQLLRGNYHPTVTISPNFWPDIGFIHGVLDALKICGEKNTSALAARALDRLDGVEVMLRAAAYWEEKRP